MIALEQKSIPRFKFEMPSERISGLISSTAPGLAGMLSDVSSIIPTRDLFNTCAGKGDITVQRIESKDIFALLRNATDASGNLVYNKAKFEIKKYNPRADSDIYCIQTFVMKDKLDGLDALYNKMSGFGASVQDGSSYIIKSDGAGQTYASILIPPVILYYDSDGFNEPIKKVKERLASNDQIIISGIAGNIKFDMSGSLREIIEKVSKGENVKVVKDGTHRAYYEYLRRGDLTAITISNQDEKPTNIPVNFSDVVLAVGKPAPRDRYPGLTWNAIAELKKLGIDS